MSWQEKYREDKKAKVTIPLTIETAQLFKRLAKQENTGTTQLIREMIKHLISEYDDEVKDVA